MIEVITYKESKTIKEERWEEKVMVSGNNHCEQESGHLHSIPSVANSFSDSEEGMKSLMAWISSSVTWVGWTNWPLYQSRLLKPEILLLFENIQESKI